MTPHIPTPDAQNRAETLDETHLTPDGEDIANFDTMPDVYDATTAAGDGDGPANRDDRGLREQRSFRDAEAVSADSETPASFEAGAETDKNDEPDQPVDDVEKDNDPHVEKQLDKGLKETFPASDPVSINPGAD